MCKVGVSVDLIIRKNNKILLGKLSKDWRTKKKWRNKKQEWGLPGGDVKSAALSRYWCKMVLILIFENSGHFEAPIFCLACCVP